MRPSLHPSLAALVVALGLGAACATSTGGVALTDTTVEDGSRWPEVLREHTRRVEVYDWTVRQIDLRATLVTPRLRSAFIAARPRFHGRVASDLSMDLVALGQPPDEGVDAPIQSRPRAEEQVIIYLCMYVTEATHRDIAASYSIWDVKLVRGQAEAEPISIEQEKYTPAVEEIFPHADRFDEIYVLRFPLVDAETGTPFVSPGGDPLELKVQSALGSAVVGWELE